jgi:catechol 2,3-dioxygenase-like lactoylglutathione lyase family enzyme
MAEQEIQSLDNIHHIAINVHDIDSAVQWYQTSFSCELKERDTFSAILSFGNIELHLHLPSQHRPHLGFEKADAETFGKLRPQLGGLRSAFIADSTGNPVELIQPKTSDV